MRWKILRVVVPLVFLIDQATKWGITHRIPRGGTVTILPHFFDIVHTTNRGAAFGAFANLPDRWRVPFFLVSSLFALVTVLFYFVKLHGNRSALVSLSLILGGALGNIFDRIVRGEVVDFLSFHWYDRFARISIGSFLWTFKLEWPAFNVADAAISSAVLWLMIATLRKKT